ncbi:MAG: hypothetical protein M3680_07145 [Myxococcota bacterium]|nr:hypothetical protein [Myxococcota bacterium]
MTTRPSTTLLASVVAGGLAGGCTGGMVDPSTVEQQEGACVALEGRRFETVSELECGRTPAGVALCKWSLDFAMRDDAASTFQWSYSDVAEAGHIECYGATITSLAGSRSVTATFDPASQKLFWEGQTYTPVP